MLSLGVAEGDLDLMTVPTETTMRVPVPHDVHNYNVVIEVGNFRLVSDYDHRRACGLLQRSM